MRITVLLYLLIISSPYSLATTSKGKGAAHSSATANFSQENAQDCFRALLRGDVEYVIGIPYGVQHDKDGSMQLIDGKLKFCEVKKEWSKDGVVNYRAPNKQKIFYYRFSNRGHDGWSGDQELPANFASLPEAECRDMPLDLVKDWLKRRATLDLYSYRKYLTNGGEGQKYKGPIICNIETKCQQVLEKAPDQEICARYPTPAK